MLRALRSEVLYTRWPQYYVQCFTDSWVFLEWQYRAPPTDVIFTLSAMVRGSARRSKFSPCSLTRCQWPVDQASIPQDSCVGRLIMHQPHAWSFRLRYCNANNQRCCGFWLLKSKSAVVLDRSANHVHCCACDIKSMHALHSFGFIRANENGMDRTSSPLEKQRNSPA